MLLPSYRKFWTRSGFIVTICALTACTAGYPETPPLPALAKPAPFTPADSAFLQKLNEANMTLLALANSAKTNAGRSDIALLGTTMAKDITDTQAQLTKLATAHALTLTDKPDAKSQAFISKTQRLHGTAFDKAYTRAVIRTHTLIQPILSTEIITSQNTDVVKFAKDTQTKLADYKTHLQ
ncbi:hypothetical protein HK27_00075 [Acetobacter orientalis]|uniref:DUF4142 domain-containing protein n=1 Tax=Acetobacter orientalis TaxID=146474 RepID=UPI000A3603E8|nr:DUF4142 domain-containing protein [Acetobacter orientalis]OUJ17976.1 hypothetical protein HK27_00075 [Acetobacter orientalis]